MTAPMPAQVRLGPPSEQERGSKRFKLNVEASETGGGGPSLQCTITDLSTTGLIVEGALGAEGRGTVTIDLPEVGWRQAQIVRQEGARIAACFDRALSEAELRSIIAGSKVVGLPFRQGGPADRAGQLLSQSANAARDGGDLAPAPTRKSLKARLQLMVLSSLLLWTLIVSAAVALLR